MGGYNKDLDKCLWTKITENDLYKVSIHSYNNGEPKIRIHHVIDEVKSTSKLGSIDLDNMRQLFPLIKESIKQLIAIKKEKDE